MQRIELTDELLSVPPLLLENYVRARLQQFAEVFSRRVDLRITQPMLVALTQEVLESLPMPARADGVGRVGAGLMPSGMLSPSGLALAAAAGPLAVRAPVPPAPRELQLVFRHDCLHLGCLDPQCVLCEHNPHRRCSVNFSPKYLVHDVLRAKCDAQIRVEVLDRATDRPVTEGLDDFALEMTVLDGNAYDERVGGLLPGSLDVADFDDAAYVGERAGSTLAHAGGERDRARRAGSGKTGPTEASSAGGPSGDRRPRDGPAAPEADAPRDSLEECALLRNNKGQPLLMSGPCGKHSAAGRVLVPLSHGVAVLPDLHISDSSEAMLNGRKPPFRLLVRAVRASEAARARAGAGGAATGAAGAPAGTSGPRGPGQVARSARGGAWPGAGGGAGDPRASAGLPPRPLIRHAVSEGFVVATRRTRTAGKVDIPNIDDHVGKLEHMGKETVKKLADLRGSAAAAGVHIDLPELTCIRKVGEFRQLASLADADGHLRQLLQQVLKLSKEKWDEVRDHAARAVVADNRMRIWYADGDAMNLGLLFTCKLGNVDLDRPVGLLSRSRAGTTAAAAAAAAGLGASLEADPAATMEVTLMAQQTPSQRDQVRALRPAALAAWWAPGHRGWAIYPLDSEQFLATGSLDTREGSVASASAARPPTPGLGPGPGGPVPTHPGDLGGDRTLRAALDAMHGTTARSLGRPEPLPHVAAPAGVLRRAAGGDAGGSPGSYPGSPRHPASLRAAAMRRGGLGSPGAGSPTVGPAGFVPSGPVDMSSSFSAGGPGSYGVVPYAPSTLGVGTQEDPEPLEGGGGGGAPAAAAAVARSGGETDVLGGGGGGDPLDPDPLGGSDGRGRGGLLGGGGHLAPDGRAEAPTLETATSQGTPFALPPPPEGGADDGNVDSTPFGEARRAGLPSAAPSLGLLLSGDELGGSLGQAPSLALAGLTGLFSSDLSKLPGLAPGFSIANLPSLSATMTSGDLEMLLQAHGGGGIGSGGAAGLASGTSLSHALGNLPPAGAPGGGGSEDLPGEPGDGAGGGEGGLGATGVTPGRQPPYRLPSTSPWGQGGTERSSSLEDFQTFEKALASVGGPPGGPSPRASLGNPSFYPRPPLTGIKRQPSRALQ